MTADGLLITNAAVAVIADRTAFDILEAKNAYEQYHVISCASREYTELNTLHSTSATVRLLGKLSAFHCVRSFMTSSE